MCVFVCLYVEPVSRSKDYIRSGIKIGSVSWVCCPRWWYSLHTFTCVAEWAWNIGYICHWGHPLVVCGHCPVTLPSQLWNIKMALIAAHQKSFWWWQCSDRYIISLSPHLHTPFPPLSPSLISLVVSVEVKHHVYCLWWNLRTLYLHTCQVRYCRWFKSKHCCTCVTYFEH